MKRLSLYTAIAIISLFTISCADDAQGPVKVDATKWDKNPDSHFASQQIIPLETADDILMGDIKSIKIYDDTYFILDSRNVIFRFDKDGKYLSKIARQGRGHGEYNDIRSIDVLGDEVYTLSSFEKKIRTDSFDGEFLREIDLNEPYFDMAVEFALIGWYRNEWMLYQYVVLDTKSMLKKHQIKAVYRGKPLNFKLYKVNDGKWEKTENIEMKDTIVIMISSYKNLKENNELLIIEKDFPYPGDSIETIIMIPNFERGKRHMDDSSKVYQFLWNNYNLSL